MLAGTGTAAASVEAVRSSVPLSKTSNELRKKKKNDNAGTHSRPCCQIVIDFVVVQKERDQWSAHTVQTVMQGQRGKRAKRGTTTDKQRRTSGRYLPTRACTAECRPEVERMQARDIKEVGRGQSRSGAVQATCGQRKATLTEAGTHYWECADIKDTQEKRRL